MTTTAYIYALCEPGTSTIRYIGKSIRPKERLQNHINEKPSNCHRSHWLQSLKKHGLRPEILILEEVDGAWPWQESERFWIAYGRTNGWPLVNNTSGGDGVEGLPEEARRRIAATWTGRKHRPESIAKLKAARARRKTSDSTRAKISAAMKIRKITWGAKIAENTRKLTPDQVVSIKARIEAGEMVTCIAKEFSMHRTSISKIKMGTYFGKCAVNNLRAAEAALRDGMLL